MIKKLSVLILFALLCAPTVSYAVETTCPPGQNSEINLETGTPYLKDDGSGSVQCFLTIGGSQNSQSAGAGTTNGTPSSGVTPPATTGTGGGTIPAANASNINSDGTLKYVPLESVGIFNDGRTPDLPSYLNEIFKILIRVGALVSVAMLAVGGVTYMVAEAMDKKTAAKARMQSAVWGLVLIAAAYLVLRTINPQLVTFNLSTTGLGSNTTVANTAASTDSLRAAITAQGDQNVARAQAIAAATDAQRAAQFTPEKCAEARTQSDQLSTQLQTVAQEQLSAAPENRRAYNSQKTLIQVQMSAVSLDIATCQTLNR